MRALFDTLRASYDYDYAISGVVRAVLLAPDFLYRMEIGTGGVMTSYEIANLLAFSITYRSPDAARVLWARALQRLGALIEEREWLT